MAAVRPARRMADERDSDADQQAGRYRYQTGGLASLPL